MSATLWMVAVFENGAWNNTWDGTLHTTKSSAEDEVAMARGAGYDVELAKVTIQSPMGVLAPESAGREMEEE